MTIHATIVNGAIVPDRPLDLPDGTRLVIGTTADEPFHMMTEEEQGDDPKSLAAWIAWFDGLEPLSMSPEDEAVMWHWKEKMKAFNVEAMRHQAEGGVP